MRLRFEQLAPADPPHTFDPWHRFALLHDDDTVQVVFEAAIDGDEFVEWFFTNEHAICTETPPFSQLPGEYLPHSYWRAWDQLPDWDVWIEPDGAKDPDDPRNAVLFDYRERHSSQFAMPGMEYPEFFFGIGQDGPELSCIGAPASWHPDRWPPQDWTFQHSPIDYPEFFRWLHQQHPDIAARVAAEHIAERDLGATGSTTDD
jgi:hypothetical protein